MCKYTEAIKKNQEALAIAQEVKDKRREAGSYLWLGISLSRQGRDIDQAEINLKKAEALSSHIQDKKKNKKATEELEKLDILNLKS